MSSVLRYGSPRPFTSVNAEQALTDANIHRGACRDRLLCRILSQLCQSREDREQSDFVTQQKTKSDQREEGREEPKGSGQLQSGQGYENLERSSYSAVLTDELANVLWIARDVERCTSSCSDHRNP